MALSTVGKRETKLLKLLDDDNVRRIILLGQPGIGKTWTARRITNIARKMGLVEVVLWIPPKNYKEATFYECIAEQLFSISTSGESDDNEGSNNQENQADLQKRILDELAGKEKLLLAIDDEGNGELGTSNGDDTNFLVGTMLNLNPETYKILIIRRNRYRGNITEISETSEIMMEPLTREESLSLLEERTGTGAFKVEGVKTLAEEFVAKTKYVPASVLLMAKAFSYFSQKNSGVQTLRRSLEEVPDNKIYNITHFLQSGYDMLPKNILIDCCWPGSHFYRDCGHTHPMELIAYWMLEGYLGDIDSTEKAYEKGYQVLMELLDCQILKKVEGDYVTMHGAREKLDKIVMENEIFSLDDCYRRGFCGTAFLGLASVLGEVLWRTSRFSFSLIDDNASSRHFVSSSLQSLQELHVGAFFNTRHKTLSLPLDNSSDPYMLVFRGCHFLEKVDLKSNFEQLTVLEISGPSPLNVIPDDFFKNMPKLQSINLSALQIASLPSSLYELSELRWLILRECSSLKTLRSIKQCKDLMVLDLSGAKLLEHVEDKIFSQNSCLQMLNFSETKIKRFPIVNNLPKLTHLLLHGCTELVRLPFINGIKTLQVLDLSGSTKVEELKDQSLENLSNLMIFDLSGTLVRNLPSNLGNPFHLSLKECTQLENLAFMESLKALEVLNVSKAPFKSLPSLSQLSNLRRLSLSCCSHLEDMPDWNSLEKLEELDLSGCTALKTLQGTSFEKLPRLRRLNLSETKIKSLPSLSYLSNLRCLLLKRCTELEVLPHLESMSTLEELNLRGIKQLREIVNGVDFLKNKSQLQVLDLSETQLEHIPSLSNLRNLCQLYLSGCSSLQEVHGLEKLTELEVLDLSGTSVGPLPFLANFTKLHQLLLSDQGGHALSAGGLC
ncbi:hypothetical protein NMG60_11022343 [Bertholletia excelsa]